MWTGVPHVYSRPPKHDRCRILGGSVSDRVLPTLANEDSPNAETVDNDSS